MGVSSITRTRSVKHQPKVDSHPLPLLLHSLDSAAAEDWIRAHVDPVGAIETVHARPWATVMRVPVTGGLAWFKACAQVQAFEPRLTAELYARWPDRVTEVLAVDEARRWLLLGDAGVADWGDSSIAHPFCSLVVTFRFLEEFNHLGPADAWFHRLRDAYLEPWGSGLEETFEIALRVGWFAHAIAWTRQRDALSPDERPDFDRAFAIVLRRALAHTRA